MSDFVLSELRRLRAWGALAAALHLVALAFASRMTDLAQVAPSVHQAIGAIYGALGFLLGLYQIGSHRRPGTWLSLLHRPVPPSRIAAALLLAGMLLLVVAIGLPLGIVAAWQKFGTSRVLDLRHVALAGSGLLIASIGYLAGAYAALRRWREAAVMVAVALLLATMRWSGKAALVFELALAAWLAALVVATFRPDPDAPPHGVAAGLLHALPLQLAVYLLMLFGGYVYETGWILQGTHPNNVATPLAGGHNEVERMDPRDRMIAALRGSPAADAPLLREQAALSDVVELDPVFRDASRRDDMTTPVPGTFVDDDARIAWTFSRDRMRFEGRSTVDGRRAGELARTDGSALADVAVPVGGLGLLDEGDLFLVAGPVLYQYDAQARRLVERLRLRERIVGLAAVGENLVLLGEHDLYVAESRDIALPDEPLTVSRRLPLAGPIDELSRVDLLERVEGHLVALTFSAHAHEIAAVAPDQVVLSTDDTRRIAQRTLAYNYPALFRYRSWWPSPAMYTLFNAARGAIDAPMLQPSVIMRAPRSVLLAALACMLASMLGAAVLLARIPASRARVIAWLLICGVVGIPALVALWLTFPPAYRRRMPLHATGAAA